MKIRFLAYSLEQPYEYQAEHPEKEKGGEVAPGLMRVKYGKVR